MKRNAFGAVSILSLLLAGVSLRASGDFQLETAIYVFKGSDTRAIEIPNDTTAGAAGSTVLRSPATARFGAETLSLNGAGFAWSGGRNPPDGASRIETPSAPLTAGRPLVLLFTSPVQYLERDARGGLQVREIPGDSPDAPHWRLTFTLSPAADEGGDRSLECKVDVASVGSREELPGVALPVGKPVLARFDETLALKLNPEEWSAFIVRAPQDGDFTMLALVRIVPAVATGGAAGPDRLVTAQEFAVFSTYYYRNPQPEKISHAIESLAANRFLDSSGMRYSSQYRKRATIAVGFFAKVFQSNPALVPEWKSLVERRGQDADVKHWLRRALKLSQAGADLGLASNKTDALNGNDIAWGAFMASGEADCIRRLVDRLELVDSPDLGSFLTGADAMTMLAFQAPHHPLVARTLESARADSSPRTRELIDDLLTKGYATVELRLSEMQPNYRSPNIDWGLTTNPGGIPPPPPPRMEQR